MRNRINLFYWVTLTSDPVLNYKTSNTRRYSIPSSICRKSGKMYNCAMKYGCLADWGKFEGK